MNKVEYEKYKIISFTDAGRELAERLLILLVTGGKAKWAEGAFSGNAEDDLRGESHGDNAVESLDDFVKENFDTGNVLVFIGAAGIAVRAIAPYIKDKTKDPAVIVIDEKGRNVIPILSGHIGGGVKEARLMAMLLGAKPVLTTATDVENEFAVDVYAKANDLVISDMKAAKEFTARLLEEKKGYYFVDEGAEAFVGSGIGYENVVRVKDVSDLFIDDANPEKKAALPESGRKNFFVISYRDDDALSALGLKGDYLKVIPKCIAVGMGCKKGTGGDSLYSFCLDKLKEAGIDARAVDALASASIKKDEEGLKYVADKLDAYFVTFEADDLMAMPGDFESSEFALEVTGCDNICERAVVALGAEGVLVHKTKGTGMTFAAGVMRPNKKGSLTVVGIGPGAYEDMTVRAQKALLESDVIAGYTVYCDLVRPYYKDKEYISTPMMGEEKRVELALLTAAKGKAVSLISSGDAGVYGMAGLAFLLGQKFPDVDIRVIPGVTAALSGAALLGAPLIHDFCLISMSDRLTPLELIEKRLRCAAMADMSVVIYNPESKGRKGYLKHACEILLETLPADRVCGIANNIGRDGESCSVMTLAELKDADADMFSTVFIGNSTTANIGGKMVTQRGYKSER
ncbi:cobalt-precorrin 5A hydrolase / precorrin-3B C17-methyltransferase [Butyrivibrio sp. INlla21]|nr:precorrin-3B C(17)-methyltransferase [Butyrivibrio sp. INlla21]SFU34380.1 cobalt-precorrin 5A hydrolase / precorrin-3B C17-methyltransferase [Butyrivibrio sp. INlla21]